MQIDRYIDQQIIENCKHILIYFKGRKERKQEFSEIQGKLVPKLTLVLFLTLSVRNGPNLQSYLFQAYISLNPIRVEQKYTKHLLKMAKTIY